jgi:hypothetical protein
MKNQLSYKDLAREAKSIPAKDREAHSSMQNICTKECIVCHGVMIQEALTHTNKSDKYWFCTKCIYREPLTSKDVKKR